MSETRCDGRYPGTPSPRCERWRGHDGPHAMNLHLPEHIVSWNDTIPCENCGQPIEQRPNDYLGRWWHFSTQDTSCRLNVKVPG